jgi:integrase/transposase
VDGPLHDTHDERPKQQAIYGKTRAEVAEKLTAAMADRNKGLVFDDENMTVAEYLDSWLSGSVRGSVRQSTYDGYEIAVRVHIKPALGRLKLKKLTPAHVTNFYQDRLAAGFAPASVNKWHVTLHKALDQAVKWHMLSCNVCEAVKAPRPMYKEMRALSAKETRRLLDATRGDRLEALYVLAVHTGMRQGELLALKWSDVDLENATISVRRTITKSGTRLLLGEPKTKKSRRTICLTEVATEALRDHLQRQMEEMERLERIAHRPALLDAMRHERLLEGPQAQGARRGRPERPEEGGRSPLRSLGLDAQALAEAARANRGGRPQAFAGEDAEHLQNRRGAACPVGAARRELRGYPGAPLRAVGGAAGSAGVGLDDEPGGAQAGLDVQKKSLVASERDEQARGTWRERLKGIDPERLVFVDECSTNVAMVPRYARSPKGQRAYGKAPRNWGKNVTLISSITLLGIGPSMSIEGPSDTESFGLFLREVLCPALRRGQIVVMDNLSVHKSAWARELVEAEGAEVLLLPPYSPDFNPIEEAFSKVKGALRRAKARTLAALFEATHSALGSVTAQDARGFFGDCGYRPPMQSM